MTENNISLMELCGSIAEGCEVLGARVRYVSNASALSRSTIDSVAYCSKSTDDALVMIRESKAGVVICSNRLGFSGKDYQDKTLVLVSNPRLAFIEVMQKYFQEAVRFGIDPTTVVDKDAKIHQNVRVGPNSYIGECEIGENTLIHGNVCLYSKVTIGKRVIIHAGTVIGADGQAYERDKRNVLRKFPQKGGVIIGDDVEIGSNVSIMRGTFDDTVVGKGTKIGHLCSVGHNVVVGKHCLIVTHSMLGGSSRIGDYSQVSLGACIRDGVNVGRNVTIGMGSVVTKDIDDNSVAYGTPAKEVRKVQ